MLSPRSTWSTLMRNRVLFVISLTVALGAVFGGAWAFGLWILDAVSAFCAWLVM